MLWSLSLLLSCQEEIESAEERSSVCSGGDSASWQHSGGSSAADSAGEVSPPAEEAIWSSDRDWSGLELVDEDDQSLAKVDYRVSSFEITESFSPSMISAPGERPRFRVAWPQEPDPDRVYGVILDLHGGSTDVDSEDYGLVGRYGRCTAAYAQDAARGRLDGSPLPRFAAQRGWITVVPENLYCDGWVGQGEEDPVDASHRGQLLAELALEAAATLREDLAVSRERVVVTGSSLGAMGAAWFASQHPDLATLVLDSGPLDVERYISDEDYSPYPLDMLQERYIHTLGGLPWTETGEASEWAERYQQLSGLQSLEAGQLELPLVHLYNSRDGASPPVQHEEMTELLSQRQPGAAPPWMDRDIDHDSPTHGQLHAPRSLFTSWAVMEFIAGREVYWLEGEEGEGELGNARETPDDSSMSQNSVRQVLPEEGAGTFYRSTLTGLAADSQFRARFFVQPEGDIQEDAELTLRILDGGSGEELSSLTVRAGELDQGDGTFDQACVALESLTLEGSTLSSSITAELTTDGGSAWAIDLVILAVEV